MNQPKFNHYPGGSAARPQQPRRRASSGASPQLRNFGITGGPVEQEPPTQQGQEFLGPANNNKIAFEARGAGSAPTRGQQFDADFGSYEDPDDEEVTLVGVIVFLIFIAALVAGGVFLWNKYEDYKLSKEPWAVEEEVDLFSTPFDDLETTTPSSAATTLPTKSPASPFDPKLDGRHSNTNQQTPLPPYIPPAQSTWDVLGPFEGVMSQACERDALKKQLGGDAEDVSPCFETTEGWYYYALRDSR